MEAYFYDYQGQSQVQKDVSAVLAKYGGLKVGRGPVQTRDGSIKNLAHLQGTIPVVYKGNTYNIPICISIPISHPHQPPICYVKPTSTMTIMQSPMVDATGKIYLKYLQNWKSNNDLLSLIKIMRSKFGEIPPVTSVRSSNTESTPYPAYPTYPKPEETNNMPPYPTSSFMPNPGMPNMLPYPTEPSYNFPFPSYPQQQPQGNLPYPTNNPYPTPTFPQPYPPAPTNNDTNASNTITEEHIKASLLSAVEDKLKRRLKEFFSQNEAEIETLRKTQQELNDGQNKLDRILSGLNLEHTELVNNISLMKEKEDEIEKRITQYSDQEVDPDEAVVTTAPLYTQLLNAYAEESTTEDAIYYMGEALRMGVIDLDVFLKQVRALSRKQFTLRALMQKCRQKAGLAF